jgi:hypothetical protein
MDAQQLLIFLAAAALLIGVVWLNVWNFDEWRRMTPKERAADRARRDDDMRRW